MQPHRSPLFFGDVINSASTAYNIIIDLRARPRCLSVGYQCRELAISSALVTSDEQAKWVCIPLICIHIANLPMPTRNKLRRPARGCSQDANGATSARRHGLNGPLWHQVPSNMAAAINPPMAVLPCPRELRAPKNYSIAINCCCIVGSVGGERAWLNLFGTTWDLYVKCSGSWKRVRRVGSRIAKRYHNI